jgi:hypothetical protein
LVFNRTQKLYDAFFFADYGSDSCASRFLGAIQFLLHALDKLLTEHWRKLRSGVKDLPGRVSAQASLYRTAW